MFFTIVCLLSPFFVLIMESEVLPKNPGEHLVVARTPSHNVVLVIDVYTNYVWGRVSPDDESAVQACDRSTAGPIQELRNAGVYPRKFFFNCDGFRPYIALVLRRKYSPATGLTPEHRYYNYLWRHIWNKIKIIIDCTRNDSDCYDLTVAKAVQWYNEHENDLHPFAPLWLMFWCVPPSWPRAKRQSYFTDPGKIERDRATAFDRLCIAYHREQNAVYELVE